jgi:hypothetical protein
MSDHTYAMAIKYPENGGWTTCYCVACGFRMEVDPDHPDYGNGTAEDLWKLTYEAHNEEHLL